MAILKAMVLCVVTIAVIGCSAGLTEAEVDLRVSEALSQFEAGLPQPLPTPTPVMFPPTATPVTFPPTPTAITFPTPSQGGAVIPADLSAESLTLRDSAGNTRVLIAANIGDSYSMAFFDTTGKLLTQLVAAETFQVLTMSDGNGASKITLGAVGGNASLTFEDEGGEKRINLGVSSESGDLSLYDRFGNLRAVLSVFQNGVAQLQILDSAGGVEGLVP